MTDPNKPPFLGIDLGTSTCLACVMQGETPLFIQPDLAFPQRNRSELEKPGILMPSVFCNRDGEELTGERAKDQMTDQNHVVDVVFDVKSYMKWDAHKTFPSGGRNYSPSQIAGVYVKKLLLAARRQLNLPEHAMVKAVVTVPTAFGMTELGATRRACANAGLLEDHVWLVDEPVAAAYSLRLHKQPGKQLVLVVDLGGGTFDATLLRAGEDVPDGGYEELGRDGDANLGGRNWDKELADWVARETFDEQEARRWLDGKDGYRTRRNELFLKCEQTKIDFFNRAASDRRMSFEVSFRRDPTGGESGRLDTKVEAESFYHRDKFLVERCVHVCKRLFDDVSRATGKTISWGDLNLLYLAGGGSKMWTVQKRFEELCPKRVKIVGDPQLAVANGAALIAEEIRNGRIPRLIGRRRYPNEIGVQTRSARDGSVRYTMLIPRNRVLPIEPPLVFRFPPFSGGNGASLLCIPIVERKPTPDGPVEVPVKELTMRVPPAAMRGRDEEIVVVVSCDNDEGRLDFKIQFRKQEVVPTITQKDLPGGGNPGTNGRPRP